MRYDIPPIKSPWILPPEKAPHMWTSALIVLSGFILLFGYLFYSFHTILSGGGFNFMEFSIIMLIAMILLIVGAIRLAQAYGSKKYAMLRKYYMEQRRKQY